MYLKYWYEDELREYAKLNERGSKWIWLNSREFKKVFGYSQPSHGAAMVHLTRETTIKVIARPKSLERWQH